MCEIQFIKNLKENINKDNFKNFSQLCILGNSSNNDAIGIFNAHYIFKNNKTENLFKDLDLKQLYSDNFIIGHNRFKTTNNHEDNINNHPFILNEFMLVHNGILRNYEELIKEFKLENLETKTDSYLILWLINNYFVKNKLHGSRQNQIKNAIKNACKKLNGSFSVMLLDKTTKDIYYFKNDITSFDLIKHNNIFYGSTNRDNFNAILLNEEYQKDKKYSYYDIKDNMIYLITNKLYKLGKIKFKEVYTFTTSYKNYEPLETTTIENNSDNALLLNAFNCAYCNDLTKSYSFLEKKYVCENCIEEHIGYSIYGDIK